MGRSQEESDITDTQPLVQSQASSWCREPFSSASDLPDIARPAVHSPDCVPYAVRKHASPGLEFLCLLDKLLVKRKLEVLEILTGIETKNRYSISSSNEELIFSAFEESDFCDRSCCPASIRPFDMRIQDMEGRVVMMLSRRLACDSCCFPCCLMQRMEVASPPGNVIGYIVQEFSLFHPKFRIEDPIGEVIMRMEGLFWQVTSSKDIDFSIFSKDGSRLLARIRRTGTGLRKQVIPDSESLEVSFKRDLTVSLKPVILGACFLIDFMYNDRI